MIFIIFICSSIELVRNQEPITYFLKVDCIWSEWVSSECSQSCDGGTLTRSREKLVEENHGGICPDNVSSETESCNEVDCWFLGWCII